MGRTYKRNDLHNSRRPKSIREKRQFGGSKKSANYDNYSDDYSGGNYNARPARNDYSAQEDYDS